MIEKNKTGGNDETLLATLAAGCRGLSYMSETDAPLEPFFIADSARKTFEQISADLAGGRPIGKVGFDQFFERLMQNREWYTPAQQAAAKRFARLKDVLEAHFKDLRVIRCGRIKIDIFVVGRENQGEGNFAGIKTSAVET